MFILVRIQTTGEDLEVRVTPTGKTAYTDSATCVAATRYCIRWGTPTYGKTFRFEADTENRSAAFFLEHRDGLKVEVRKTTNNGAGNLQARVAYQVYQKAAMCPEHQPDIDHNEANPVQNTWYTILAATDNVRLYNLHWRVVGANENVEVRTTIDGVEYDGNPVNAVSVDGTVYNLTEYQHITSTATREWGLPTVFETERRRAFLREGRNVKVEIRITSNNGATSLDCYLRYAKWI